MAHTTRFGYSTVLFVVLLLAAGEAEAGWWHRHCATCGSSGGYYGSASPAGAPSAAPAYYYAIPAQAAPAQGLLTSLQDIASVVKLIQGLRGSLGNFDGSTSGGGTTGGGASSGGESDSQGIAAALSRIEASQEDLRGRLINNAGILQAIGERLGDQGPIMLKLDSLNSNALPPPPPPGDAGKVDGATETKPTATSATETKPSSEFVTTADFNQFKVDLSGQLKMLQDTVNKLDANKSQSTEPKTTEPKTTEPKTKSQSLTPKQ